MFLRQAPRPFTFGDPTGPDAQLYDQQVAELAALLAPGQLAVAPGWRVERTLRGVLHGGERLVIGDLLPTKAEDGTTLESAFERASRLLARGELVGRLG